jgi:hypothetical protein
VRVLREVWTGKVLALGWRASRREDEDIDRGYIQSQERRTRLSIAWPSSRWLRTQLESVMAYTAQKTSHSNTGARHMITAVR